MTLIARCLLLAALLAPDAMVETVRVATAANFRKPAAALSEAFAAATGHDVVLSAASTGQLYAQIAGGAPFDVLLAADAERPRAAVEAGLAVPGTAFTYATGRLVLICREDAEDRCAGPPDLAGIGTLSIANPQTAPYGAAAMEVLGSFGVLGALSGRIAHAQSVSGVNAAVHAGAAEAGFAALGSLAEPGGPLPEGWIVPRELHAPIRQDAVLLAHGADNPAARAFLDFLRGEKATALIRGYGYDVD